MSDLTPEVMQAAVDHTVAVSNPEENAPPVEMHPAEEAAMKFTKLLPYVKKFGAVMSAKGLTRVLHASAEFPLGATKPRLLNDNERQLFHVIQELQGYKGTVIQNILQQNAEGEKQKMQAINETEIHRESSQDKPTMVSQE